MHYLSIMADDIAKAIPFVMDEKTDESVEGFGELKHLVVNEGAYSELKALFDELTATDSWWAPALKRGSGIRQRITHYPDLVVISASQSEGDSDWKAHAHLHNRLSGKLRDYIETLREILAKLCSWLDLLETVLVAALEQRATRNSITWKPPAICPRIHLLVELPLAVREIPEADYLYLPVCDE